MKIGPKFKIARRLGAPVFEKTQTQKYALSLARKERSGERGYMGAKSEYAKELTEKQKARYTYGIGGRQFRGYVLKALKSKSPSNALFALLESRLDNVLYRSGLAKTRAQARQAASHGHIMVNGKRVTVPSILLKKGDKASLRLGSANSPLFADASERMKALEAPVWIKADPALREVEVVGEPVYAPEGNSFDLGTVIEFYNR